MKKFFFLPLLLAAMFLSCKSQQAKEDVITDAGTKVFCYKDSCEHLIFSLSLEVPMGEDSASTRMRDSLIAHFIDGVSYAGINEEGQNGIKPFTGDKSDAHAVVEYYGKSGYDYLLSLAMNDYKSRLEWLDEDTTMTDEDRQRIKEDVPMWAFDLNINKSVDTLDIVVYNISAYTYCGGAHGGVIGPDAITFFKSTGAKVDNYLEPSSVAALQPLIRKGLIQYYESCGETITDAQLSERLQIEGDLIPLPVHALQPNASLDSLIFTYGQYEIACYADGMPSFLVSAKELMPYLTAKAKKIFQE